MRLDQSQGCQVQSTGNARTRSSMGGFIRDQERMPRCEMTGGKEEKLIMVCDAQHRERQLTNRTWPARKAQLKLN